MQKLLFILVLIITGSASLLAQSDTSRLEITWDKQVHDFKSIKQGTPVEATFTFTNTGNVPVSNIFGKTDCSCSKIEYNREPVMPGKTGTVKVSYNAVSTGFFEHGASVNFNPALPPMILKVKGAVLP